MSLPIYANPAEAPDWQREACKPMEDRFEHRNDRTGRPVFWPVYRVPCRTAPIPDRDGSDFLTKRFTEVK